MIALADCAVAVSNAKEAARWWKEKLGFAVHTVGGGDHAVMVAPPGDRFILHLCEGFEPLEPGNSGIAFVTDDIEGWVRRMTESGVSFPTPFQKQEWGGMAKFSDPDGNVYWLLGAPATFIRTEARRVAPRASTFSAKSRSRRSSSARTPTKDRRAQSDRGDLLGSNRRTKAGAGRQP